MFVEICILFALFAFLFQFARSGKRGRYPPGPFGVPFLGVLPFLGKSPHKAITNYGKKYGKIFSLQLGSYNLVILNDFDLIKKCFKQESFAGRPKDQMEMFSLIPHGIAYNEGPEMHEMRRFTLKNLRDFGFGKKCMNDMMLEEVEGLVNYFKENAEKPLEVKRILDIAIFNSLMYISAGKKVSLDDQEMLELNRVGQISFMEPAVAGTVYFLPWLSKIFPTWSKLNQVYFGVDYYLKHLTKLFEEHKATFIPSHSRDLADCFLKEANDAKDGSYFTGERGFKNFINLFMNLYVAGSDTSSTTLSWAIVYFLNFPEVLRKVQAEIDTEKFARFCWGKQGMNQMMLEEVEGLINFLKTQTGNPIELKHILDIAILNSVAHLIAGKRYELDDKKMIEMNKIGQAAFMEPAVAGTVYFLPWIAKIFPSWSKLNNVHRGIDFYTEYFKNTYEDHKASFDINYCRDLTDCYLKEEAEAKDRDRSYYCGEKGFRNFVDLLIALFLAGSDTSSTTLSWSVVYLLHNPNVMKKIQAEIDAVVGRSRLPTGSDRPQMPYTEASMWEIMRMSAIVPGAVLHSTMEDVEVEGYKLPKRTIIMPNLHHVHHDKEYWGDPETFRPERFLTPDGAFIKNERVIPFSIGKRVCIAESLAQTTVFMFLTGMLQNFNIVLPPGHPLPPLEGKYGLVVNTKPYKVLFEPR